MFDEVADYSLRLEDVGIQNEIMVDVENGIVVAKVSVFDETNVCTFVAFQQEERGLLSIIDTSKENSFIGDDFTAEEAFIMFCIWAGISY